MPALVQILCIFKTRSLTKHVCHFFLMPRGTWLGQVGIGGESEKMPNVFSKLPGLKNAQNLQAAQAYVSPEGAAAVHA